MSELIDTTEMYLRTIFELTEEGVLPMRARIVQRLGQSGPTVSETVARMNRDGLVELDRDDRHLVLTASGSELAARVMRKHRLAECLLVDVIGLPWEAVHAEACRWEHVMSEAVEQRLVEILGHPTTSPFGNPIPGLDELALALDNAVPPGIAAQVGHSTLATVAEEDNPQDITVLRISEALQSDESLMAGLHRVGATPGGRVETLLVGDTVRIGSPGNSVELSEEQAAKIIVTLG